MSFNPTHSIFGQNIGTGVTISKRTKPKSSSTQSFNFRLARFVNDEDSAMRSKTHVSKAENSANFFFPFAQFFL
jgi:hypothetical protein